MPLRDHFRPPLDDEHSWDALHGGWPMVIATALNRKLPRPFIAAPQVHMGSVAEIDVAGFDRGGPTPGPQIEDGGGVATSLWAPPRPTLDVPADLSGQDIYEVRVLDTSRNRRLVAAVEIISPSNKDRPDSRSEFAAKCAALLRARVSVAVVDVVTTRHSNLYADLLELIGEVDPTMGAEPPGIYAAECRWTGSGRLQTWSHVLTVGRPLPLLPLWLSDTLAVPLDLDTIYEQTCRDLLIA